MALLPFFRSTERSDFSASIRNWSSFTFLSKGLIRHFSFRPILSSLRVICKGSEKPAFCLSCCRRVFTFQAGLLGSSRVAPQDCFHLIQKALGSWPFWLYVHHWSTSVYFKSIILERWSESARLDLIVAFKQIKIVIIGKLFRDLPDLWRSLVITHPLQLLLLPQTAQESFPQVVDMRLELNNWAITLGCWLLRS